MGLTPAAFGDERIVVVPEVGIHTESDQERAYAIPGGGFYVETLTAAAPARRVMISGLGD